MLKELINKLKGGTVKSKFRWVIDPDGLNILADKNDLNRSDELATTDLLFGHQYVFLKSLEEAGIAERFANGWTITAEQATLLDDEFSQLFELPSPLDARFEVKIQGQTTQSAFNLRLIIVLSNGEAVENFRLDGPFVRLTDTEIYKLSHSDWSLLATVDKHQNLTPDLKSEYANNNLIYEIQQANNAGSIIDLAHFESLTIHRPDKVAVVATENEDGDLLLTPSYGEKIPVNEVISRLGQLKGEKDESILRVGDEFLLLDKDRLEATREILTNHRIPKEQVKSFLSAPTSYLNAALIDLDTGFSVRVKGATRFIHAYFGESEKSGIDWFHDVMSQELFVAIKEVVNTQEELDEVAELVNHSINAGSDTIIYNNNLIDISDTEQVRKDIGVCQSNIDAHLVKELLSKESDLERAVVDIEDNDEEQGFSVDIHYVSESEINEQTFTPQNLKRQPFPHQVLGINWALAHMERGKKADTGTGALLADDMGLGKTYMILVSIDEYYKRCKQQGDELKPTLIVAPLTLIENWIEEIDKTFYKSPFSDVITLLGAGDLRRFKIAGSGTETKQHFKGDDSAEIRYSLKVGREYGADRLDVSGRLVITTYQTLRDYQFSLNRVDWSVVAFDEAQNIKNPNTLVTRAAKGLKADLRLLATGTPVENSLKDFWCLFDTAVPGLLGTWKNFQSNYIKPILSSSVENQLEVKLAIGNQLREIVGTYMLRRTKEEELEGLPRKIIWKGVKDATGTYEFDGALASTMTGSQLNKYNSVLSVFNNSENKLGKVLPCLNNLRWVSVHHDLSGLEKIVDTKELIIQAYQSQKLKQTFILLEQIKQRQEKVIIFTISKQIQRVLALLIRIEFGVSVDIVNGETKAVSGNKQSATRKGIVDKFQNAEGFGVIVMSPLAAGVGLTITGANNVIHLERHWNPAKEEQATDRVYRIGQERVVNVYVPMSIHPEVASFDLQLNRLLSRKVDLRDAIVAPNIVQAEDMQSLFDIA